MPPGMRQGSYGPLKGLVLTAEGEFHPAQRGRPVMEAAGIALVL